MPCTSPINLPKHANGSLATGRPTPPIPCSRCLHCRLQKRDQTAARCLLENLVASSAQFWTLTFSQPALKTLEAHGPRTLVRRFFSALRKKERQAGNQSTIRYFGCLEFGETTGRPHIHLLIWNMRASLLQAEPYRQGLPRPKYTIGQWPHGHVDCCPFNQSAARYVSKYVTKFETSPDLKPMCFHPVRPALGFDGLALHVANTSRGPSRRWEQSQLIEIDGKKWPLHPTLRPRYWELLKQHGMRHTLDRMTKKQLDQQIRRELQESEPWHLENQRLTREATRDRLFHQTLQKAHARREAILLRASLLHSQDTPATSSSFPSSPDALNTSP